MSKITAGVTTPTALTLTGDTTGEITFEVSGTVTAATIDSSGNVGIGTSSPGAKLDVQGGRSYFAANSDAFATYLRYNSSTAGVFLGSPSADAFQISKSSGAAYLNIDSSGNVGIGTSSPNFKEEVNQGSGSGAPSLRETPQLVLKGWGGGGTYHSGIGFSMSEHTAGYWGSGILEIDDTGSYGAALGFYTSTGSAAASPTEKLRIGSNGNVGIGGTASAANKVEVSGTLPTSSAISRVFSATGTVPSGTTSVAVGFNTELSTQAASFTITNLAHFAATQGTIGAGSSVTAQYGFLINSSLTGATNNYGVYSNIASGSGRWNFYAGGTAANYFAGETYVGATTDNGAYNLQCNGTGVWGAGAYVNGSDARIKEDVNPIASGLDVVEKLNPVTYRYKESWSKDQRVQTGFIAQELLTAFDGQVYADGVVQQGGSEGYYSVAYQNIIPILTKAIQELKAENDALKARLDALEAQ